MRLIESLEALASVLKKKDIPYRDLQVGDIICDWPEIYRVEKIKKSPEGGLIFLDANNNGTSVSEENLGREVRIIPREFLAEEPYE